MSRLVAYIDILGARYWSKVSQESYRVTLEGFQRTILDKAYLLRDGEHVGPRVFCFNDCAYLECSSARNLVNFLQQVRYQLSRSKTFVKGALAYGTLKTVESGTTPKAPDKAPDTGESDIRAELLDGDAIKVYALADSLKGIGFRVEAKLARSSQMKGRIVRSCYVPTVATSAFDCFDDIRYLEQETTVSHLGAILSECYRINSEESSGGRYFVSSIVSLTRSLDWPQADPFDEDKVSPVIGLLLKREFWTRFSDLPGVDCIFGCLLDETVARAGAQAKITRRIFDRLGSLRGANRRAAVLSPCILSRQAKLDFLTSLAETLNGKKQPTPASQETAAAEDGDKQK